MTGTWQNTGALYLVLVMLAGCAGQYARAPVTVHATPPEPRARVWKRTGASARDTEYYVVRRGDTLYSLAWQQGLDFQQLARLNGIAPPYTIYPGQRLRLHVGTAAPPGVPLTRRSTLRARPLAAHASPPARAARPAPAAAATPSRPSPGPPASAASGQTTASNRVEYDGKWVWPVRGSILHPYREDGNGKKGIDIGGRAGQPVRAAASGKVVYVGSGLVGYGRLIIIKHNDNLLSAYGHNSALLVAEGEYVRAGQTIAKMGSSGTSRTMLYFEIRKDGKPVNPVHYLP